jgi:hypothetical protein
MFSMFKKGQISSLGAIGLAFVVATIILSLGQTILAEVLDTQTPDTLAANTTVLGQTGITNIVQWLPVLGLVVGASLVILTVVNSFRGGTSSLE